MPDRHPSNSVTERHYPLSGAGWSIGLAYVLAALMACFHLAAFYVKGAHFMVFPALVVLIAFGIAGRTHALSVTVRDGGVYALTLGGRRWVPWDRFVKVVNWADPDVRRHSPFLMFRVPYGRFLGRTPYVDGAAFLLASVMPFDGWLAVSEVLTVDGRDAIGQICRRLGVHLSNRHELPLARWADLSPLHRAVGYVTLGVIWSFAVGQVLPLAYGWISVASDGWLYFGLELMAGACCIGWIACATIAAPFYLAEAARRAAEEAGGDKGE